MVDWSIRGISTIITAFVPADTGVTACKLFVETSIQHPVDRGKRRQDG